MKKRIFEIPLQTLQDSGIPSLYQRCGVNDLRLTKKQVASLSAFCESPKKGILISGQSETGKTTLACVLLKSLFARHQFTVAYIDLRTLVNLHFKEATTHDPDRYLRALKCDALVIDDCESHKNEGCFMALDYVYRARLAEGKTTIVVCEEDETCEPLLAQEFGRKLADKIKHNSVHISLDANEAD